MGTTITRTISGAVYVLLLIAATLYSRFSFLLLVGMFMILSVVEFCKLIRLKPAFPLLIAAAGFILFNLNNTNLNNTNLNNTTKNNDVLLLIAALLVSIKSLLFLFEKNSKYMNKASKYVFLIGYLIIPIIIFTKIPFIHNEYHPKIIISILTLIWANDTFAYLVGRTIGKHKLFERISPKKTIEGFLGGICFSILAGILLAKFYLIESSLLQWIMTAILVSIFGTLGDLIESKFKRNAGVKDSGNIMPGHGGILDRLDSIIFASPFVYLLYQILYYVS